MPTSWAKKRCCLSSMRSGEGNYLESLIEGISPGEKASGLLGNEGAGVEGLLEGYCLTLFFFCQKQRWLGSTYFLFVDEGGGEFPLVGSKDFSCSVSL